MKRLAFIMLAAAIALGAVAGLVWHVVGAADCFDRSGTLVFPLTGYQQCHLARDP